MKKRYGRWSVNAPGHWWQEGQWHQNPDFAKRCSSHASPRTKKGAFRIAGLVPAGTTVYVVCRYSRTTKRFPNGFEREWIYVK
jgi:hypothetical protein